MKGRPLALLLLVAAVAWLVLSYLPPEQLTWQITPDPRLRPLGRWLLVLSALVFIALQVWLVRSSFHFSQRGEESPTQPNEPIRPIRVRRGWEVFWTAVPLVASVALFVASYCALAG